MLPNNIFLSSNYGDDGSVVFPDVLMSEDQLVSFEIPNTAQTSSPNVQFQSFTSSSSPVSVSHLHVPVSWIQPQPTRSIRAIKPPLYLQDYMCSYGSQAHSSTSSHWCNVVHFSTLTQAQQQSITQLDHLHEPNSYREAATSPHWVKVMQVEIDALRANNTWI